MYIFLRKTFLLIGLFIFSLALFINLSIFLISKDNIFEDYKKLPDNHIGLLLGTSKYLKNGSENYFYTARIEAALTLLKEKKIEKIILSGSKDKGYDEVNTMKKDLLKNGIKENQIIEDKKGNRTNDSISFAIKNNYDKIILISQKFHLQRGIFLAKIKHKNYYGYTAKDPKWQYAFKIYLREFFSRIKLIFWDIY